MSLIHLRIHQTTWEIIIHKIRARYNDVSYQLLVMNRIERKINKVDQNMKLLVCNFNKLILFKIFWEFQHSVLYLDTLDTQGFLWSSTHMCPHMTLITDQSTTHKGVKINLHSSSLIQNKCQVLFPINTNPLLVFLHLSWWRPLVWGWN